MSLTPDSQPKSFFQSPRKKSAVCALTFVIAFFVAVVLYLHGNSAGFVIALVLGPLFFPFGLPNFALALTGNQDVLQSNWSLVLYALTCLIYIGIILGMMGFQSKRRIIILYIIFVALLVMNIVGCQATPLPNI